jgi:2-octaprenyl-6-methoxyphenol hydroxylase
VSARPGASSESYDIAIVGGGMVGASLAVALEGLGVRTALIEAVPHDAAAQPSFDERTTALSNGSRRILETLGVWQDLANAATPIRKIHVSDQGHFRFRAHRCGGTGSRRMGSRGAQSRARRGALVAASRRRPDVDVLPGARVARRRPNEDSVTLEDRRGRRTASLDTRLVVAADGARLGRAQRFRRRCVEIARLRTNRGHHHGAAAKFHDHVAYERFTAGAARAAAARRRPLHAGLDVEPAMAAEAAMGWSDEQVPLRSAARFGFRLGRLLKVGAGAVSLVLTVRSARARAAASSSAMPHKGCIRSRAWASTWGFATSRASPSSSPSAVMTGFDARLDSRCRVRCVARADRREVIAFTDGLVRVFASPLGPVRRLRNLGLLAFDLLPPAKAALSALSIGAAGRIPKLARGVPLRAAS